MIHVAQVLRLGFSMDSHDRETMASRISETNRALILLDSTGPRDSGRAKSLAVRDAQRAHDALLLHKRAFALQRMGLLRFSIFWID
jgi:hypothetical protein